MNITRQTPITILTGAGISKESGLDTFRCAGGIWERYNLEDVCSPEGYARNPSLVQEFYNGRRAQLFDKAVQPNDAHRAIARLQKEWNAPVILVTQNIDNLHERGGSENPIHMHGELTRVFCTACNAHFDVKEDVTIETVCPECACQGTVRPDIVWFGEMPYHMDDIYQALRRGGIFMAIGTSGNVYPAAGFVSEARRVGAYCVELNLEPSLGATLFHEQRYGPATRIVPQYVDELLAISDR